MSTAAARLLVEAGAAGLRLWAESGKVHAEAAAEPPAALLDRLRERKAELLALLTGEVCRYCGEPIAWRACDLRPAVAFGDSTGAHLDCYEKAEVARLLAAARCAVESKDALADPAETLTMGKLP